MLCRSRARVTICDVSSLSCTTVFCHVARNVAKRPFGVVWRRRPQTGGASWLQLLSFYHWIKQMKNYIYVLAIRQWRVRQIKDRNKRFSWAHHWRQRAANDDETLMFRKENRHQPWHSLAQALSCHTDPHVLKNVAQKCHQNVAFWVRTQPNTTKQVFEKSGIMQTTARDTFQDNPHPTPVQRLTTYVAGIAVSHSATHHPFDNGYAVRNKTVLNVRLASMFSVWHLLTWQSELESRLLPGCREWRDLRPHKVKWFTWLCWISQARSYFRMPCSWWSFPTDCRDSIPCVFAKRHPTYICRLRLGSTYKSPLEFANTALHLPWQHPGTLFSSTPARQDLGSLSSSRHILVLSSLGTVSESTRYSRKWSRIMR